MRSSSRPPEYGSVAHGREPLNVRASQLPAIPPGVRLVLGLMWRAGRGQVDAGGRARLLGTVRWWCRWTASTSPTPSWCGAGCGTGRARRRPSTPRGTPRCWRRCGRRGAVRGAGVRPDRRGAVPGAIAVPADGRAGRDRGQLPAARRAALARGAGRAGRGVAPGRRRGGAARAAGRAARGVRASRPRTREAWVAGSTSPTRGWSRRPPTARTDRRRAGSDRRVSSLSLQRPASLPTVAHPSAQPAQPHNLRARSLCGILSVNDARPEVQLAAVRRCTRGCRGLDARRGPPPPARGRRPAHRADRRVDGQAVLAGKASACDRPGPRPGSRRTPSARGWPAPRPSAPTPTTTAGSPPPPSSGPSTTTRRVPRDPPPRRRPSRCVSSRADPLPDPLAEDVHDDPTRPHPPLLPARPQSGSMQSIKADTEGGFAAFVEEQRKRRPASAG